MQRHVFLGLPFLFLPLLGCQNGKPPPPVPKPAIVRVSLPVSRLVTDYEDFTGMTAPVRFVEVRARVTGFLQKQRFEDGAHVTKGQVLFEIDPITLEATYRQTEANLRQAEAHLRTMTRNFDRAEDLRQRKAISTEDYDKAVGDRDEAQAAVGVAEANKRLAKINLDYAHVTAPISGRVGRRLVDVGNIVTADTTALTTIIDLDTMYVNFDISERAFLRIQRLIKAGKILPSQENKTTVLVGLADEKGFSLTGKVDFEDNRVDAGTGNYRLRAIVANVGKRASSTDDKAGTPFRFLSPGLFVRIRLPIGLPYKPLLVSEQALVSDQGQKYVYVVTSKIDPKTKKPVIDPRTKKPVEVVEYRPVETGGLHEGLRVITKGVDKNDRIVVSGVQHIRTGAEVQTKVEPMPEPVQLPRPKEK
jgi:RND family efflux transporter MFP subunit